ncbi:MAG TPA: MBL fold metallo-hydrolase [Bryobacteraceae bacterium]|nr:MBL fold metallo-hydrolase [Bryobacteraceae bacterium]
MTPYLEIGGDYREVLPGIFMLELPLPFSLGIINVYLVRLDSGYLLIDAGMQTEACFDALARALEGLSVDWRDIRRILLTHIHPDHMGLAVKLTGLTGAPLDLHAADYELLIEITDQDRHRDWQQEVLAAAGVPPELCARVQAAMADVQQNFRRLTPDRLLTGGESIATKHGALEVIWTPGHSPGHVCLYDRERRVLLSGDHMLEHISPNIGWQPGRDALGEFLGSLDQIAALDIDLILPAHGAPFTGHREWVRKTQQHHAERCDRIVELVAGGATTAHLMVHGLWNRRLSPFHYRFAIFEVMAHLEYLERRAVLREDRSNGVIHWATAAG